MGLGKTIQIIAYLAGLHHSGLFRPSLVVCPATVLRQWLREVRCWYPPLRVVVFHDSARAPFGPKPSKEALLQRVLGTGAGPGAFFNGGGGSDGGGGSGSSGSGLLITTYDQLRLHRRLLLGVRWGVAVLDEGHKIRNPDAEITLVCKQLQVRCVNV